KSDAKALLPGDYEAELVFDKKIYDREKSPAALTVTEALDGVLKVALIKLARPKFKIVDNTTGKEVQGVGLKLTLSGAARPNYDLGESRPSGIVELADVPGILPGKYDIKPAADRFGPTLNSPADVTLDEGSTTTTEVKVTASKGAVIVDISRYDGQKLVAHVDVKLTGSVTKNEKT